MGMDVGGKKGGVRSDINITPLVDVVLVLLIIFMVMTPLMLKQLEDVKVPEKADVDLAPPPVTVEQVVLRIAADGRLEINREPVAREQLIEKVRSLFAARREKLMFFDVDDQANYGEVVKVMDACRGAGVKILGIMTRG